MKTPNLRYVSRCGWLWAACGLGLALAACDSDADTTLPVPDDPLGIALTITVGSTTGGSPITISYRDLDGAGPAAPQVTAPPLPANTTLNANLSVTILDRGQNNDRTGFINDNDNQHQVFFLATPPTLIQQTYLDRDRDGLPLGLINRFQTGAAGTGTLRVVLRRGLNKRFNNLSASNFAQAGGVSDLDASIPITLQ
ncbi:MAG: hypothetical protein MUC97_16850 [Bernardetiaceae bacterium]|nr:hypothetical protein [Bernardetiaceae bacterium]